MRSQDYHSWTLIVSVSLSLILTSSAGELNQEYCYTDNCGQPLAECNFTLVTGVFDIGRGDWPAFRRDYEDYLSYAIPLLQSDVPLIVFIENKGRAFVSAHRHDKRNMTRIITMDLEDLEYSRYYHEIKDIMKSKEFQTDNQLLSHPEAFSELYNIVTNSKVPLLKMAAEQNPFNTSHFFWMDFGYGHGKDIIPKNRKLTPRNGMITNQDKITYISRINLLPPSRTLRLKDFFKINFDPFISGGFFGGTAAAIREYCNLHRRLFEESLIDGAVADDQAMALMCYTHRPDLFNLVEGKWYDGALFFT